MSERRLPVPAARKKSTIGCVGFDGAPQQLPLAEDLRLSGELGEVARAHPAAAARRKLAWLLRRSGTGRFGAVETNHP